MSNSDEIPAATKYVKSIKDPVKRRYATDYLVWLKGGRVGSSPERGALASAIASAVSTNLDSLI
jgi:hypothetical protein